MAANLSTSSFDNFHHCSSSTTANYIATAFDITQISLLLPLYLTVLYLGHQKWRQQRSFATTSHSDIFTYNLAAIELLYALGATFYYCTSYFGLSELTILWFSLCSIVIPGETCFHILTCVERYLAVVHPVTYLGLRRVGGVRIRNVSIGCVWLLCLGWMGIIAVYSPGFPFILYFIFLAFSLVVVSFCSLSVLCVLIRSGPGDMAGGRARVDQSKQRAFHTITAITAVLWLFFIGFLVCVALDSSNLLSYNIGCLVLFSANWITLPNSLVLPLLFLQRSGKLVCCRSSNK
ncbi:hypothetical protein Q5P01_002894 [Channa striata]|uniref:G-protein coupled receptors family 1 profile domain-containing protein n=1 Tax=Channa striata TaxID=64152 RepID=A0AA88NND3_CHASR|nr:hypothetical protein Q5P01_002894 [Channa striata]